MTSVGPPPSTNASVDHTGALPGSAEGDRAETVFDEAERAYAANTPGRAMELYNVYLRGGMADNSDETVRRREMAITRTSQMLVAAGNCQALDEYIRSLESIWPTIPRAKAAKLIRGLLDDFDSLVAQQGEGAPGQVTARHSLLQLTRDLVAWASRDKRAFLKQSLELRLAALLLAVRQFTDALGLVASLLRELKRMDDRLTLVEVHLLECRIYFQLRHGPKARAALTAARSNANSIYCPPLVQAALDMQSALVHADEGDFSTAYSYFVEALDAYAGLGDARGAMALKYMLLCKIMLGGHHLEELEGVLAGKMASRYASGPEVEAMRAIAAAHRGRSLKAFEAALAAHPTQLGGDMLVHAHFQALYDQLLEGNLLRIVAPYERVQLAYIAQAIDLPMSVVEGKLSQMILDRQLAAIIDQGAQCLVMTGQERPVTDQTFALALTTVKHLSAAIDALYQKATSIA